ncbi:MAG TPA: hypothetical protein VNL38_00990 [Candidatus Nitrosotenuis sp.]|nr:hypothetical protein [Candidatus Nitrosotenuis sp.]
MIKDPCHREETAYDLLELPPNCTDAQIKQALVRFMRNPKNRTRLQEAQQADMRLRTPAERAWINLWYYRVDTSVVETSDAEFQAALQEFRALPVLPPTALYTDIDAADCAQGQREIQFSKMRLLDLRRYDGLAETELLPPLDR